MSNKKSFLPEGVKRIIALIVGGVCSTLVLVFSVLTIVTISNGEFDKAPNFLIWVFVSMGLSTLVGAIIDRNKFTYIRSIFLLVCSLALGIIVLFAKNNPYLFSLTAGLYCLTIVIARIIKIIEKPSIRAIVFNAILIALVVFLSIGLFIPVDTDAIGTVILIECLFIALTALAEVAVVAFGHLKFRVLFKIIVNTFALEVLFGLLATMVAGSLALMTVESEVFPSFGDALWYSFTTVTTIGFGDHVATTLVGRLITVVLGIYGLIAVAVITSIIVNFYNETAGKKDAKELKNIQKDEDKR